jgi:hypothetical protein
MTQRRRFVIAAVPGALVQASFVAALHAVTAGCFCAVTGAGLPEPSPFLWWLLQVASFPLAQIPDRFYLLPFSAGDWPSALVFASINWLFWAVGLFALLNAIAFLSRDHQANPPASRPVAPRRLTTASTGRVAAGVIVMVGLVLASGASARTWWLEGADGAARATLDAVRDGRDLPYSRHGIGCFETRCTQVAPTGSYALTRRERPVVGASVMDTFVPPREWSAEAVFQDGTRYRLDVFRSDGRWEVFIWFAPLETRVERPFTGGSDLT